MMKIFKNMLLPTTLFNEIVLLFIALRLPDQVPIHLNANMEIDGLGSRWIIVAIGAIPVVFSFVVHIYWRATKNNGDTLKNRKVENILVSVITAFLTVITWLPVLVASQHDIGIGGKIDLPIDFIILFPVGVFIIVISNFMGVIKYNRLLGIRTPWTLANEMVWKRTHRLGGHTGVIGGILTCVFSVLGFIFKTYALSIIGFVLGISLVAIAPLIYSFIIYKKEHSK